MRILSTLLLLLLGTGIALAQPATVTTDIAYGDLPEQTLDLYQPADGASNAPVLVFFHGGGWTEGSKADIKAAAASLAAAGMIVAVPNYRLYPQAVFPQFVEDCAAAVGHVWQMLNAMGGRHALFIGGHSAGAFNAGMLAADEGYLAAAGVPAGAVAGYVLLSGPYNMSGSLPASYAAIFPAATRASADANAFIDGTEPPMLLMTVKADDVVNPLLTRQLAATVNAMGGRVTVATYPGSDHIATFRGLSEPGSPMRKDLAAFVAEVAGQ